MERLCAAAALLDDGITHDFGELDVTWVIRSFLNWCLLNGLPNRARFYTPIQFLWHVRSDSIVLHLKGGDL